MKEIKIAVVGNPNTGKSSLINAIAKAKLQVGNWPGVTVEKKEAKLSYKEYTLHFIDLPGAYSLTPYSIDEAIARDFLFLEDYDVILCVVDTTNLERNLYFVVQLMELEKPLVLALNMFDEAKRLGYKVDIPLLEQILEVRAVPTVAVKEQGIEELKEALVEVFEKKLVPKRLPYGEDLENLIEKVVFHLKAFNPDLERISLGVIFKILEGDDELINKLGLKFDKKEIENISSHIKTVHEVGLNDYLLDIRYGLATGVTKKVLQRPEIRRETLTEKIDKIVLNRVLGIPLFLLIMWIAFKIAFDVANPYIDFLDKAINEIFKKWIEAGLSSLGAADWLSSLVLDGIVGGVGTVLSFIPIIGMIMLMITFLEATGYMARAAFLMDRIMRSFGLQGKAFIPLLMGFGCNVPSVYACRTMEQEHERKLTMFVIPFMSCGARLPVYALFVSAFFASYSAEVLLFLYVLGIVVALTIATILHKTYFKGVGAPFIMELPPYRMPTLKNLAIHTWLKLRHFVIKAGTWILAFNIIVWMALNLPWKPEKPEDSVLGKLGHVISPVFKPLGFGDWASSASLLTGFPAKEVVVSTMAQIYGGEEEKSEEKSLSFKDDLKDLILTFAEKTKEAGLNLVSSFRVVSISAEVPEEGAGILSELQKRFTPASALSFMVFTLLYFPCMVYAAAVKTEAVSLKFVLQIILVTLTTAWIVSFLVYQFARLIF
ncbi:ferrous iron transport protein B [Thermodesulfobacterium geofontis OPF15]|uniref:Ferrous iron transport protein B n=1 Tax=Thermodesulfobacterium geofontis (strain OPF15) TaxID=795359 RepID=F8C1U8_THEGP|nr:ferrous iron transport protein B [Thermodesulfobacterium geofontis]AEH23271.1 ferrous iron transport protein B [Thermodesulfobacterium geofontis OPF15]